MQDSPQTPAVHTIWVDHENRIISFRPAEGFVPKRFPSRSEALAYAMEKGSSGYRFQ